ncbi:MAG TPA: hypothetical protein EYG89_01425 [Bacteroidia bacterium]|nr:hypothetical protein [Bacteroidia bacterium]
MIKKILIMAIIFSSLSNAAYNLDEGKSKIYLKLDRANVLNFPFAVKKANIAAENQDDYTIESINNSIIIIPTGDKDDLSDLVVTSADKNTFIISVENSGSKNVFNFTYNGESSFQKSKTSKFETNKIDADIKKLIKSVLNKGVIPGYSRVLINKKFNVKNMTLQKNYIYNGSKYRVEEWFIKNTTSSKLFIDEATFYTKGILAINLEQRELNPREVIKMIFILNKADLEKEGE